ncbi:hypothetical protein V2I01_41670 [Micromonospora sp. BRA006-A]|nr:hypothetical protein [Micromonospora sp. BRA006-A]
MPKRRSNGWSRRSGSPRTWCSRPRGDHRARRARLARLSGDGQFRRHRHPPGHRGRAGRPTSWWTTRTRTPPAVAAGAEIIRELKDEDFGTSRGYAARDLEGNVWIIGTYQPGSTPAPA